MSELGHTDFKDLYIISAVSAGLSLLGNLVIIFLYLYIKKLRIYVFRLIFYITICDSFKSIVLIIPTYICGLEDSVYCKVFGYVFAYSAISGSIWVLAIAVSLNQILVKNHHNIERYHGRWVLFAFGFTAGVTALPFLTDSYGFSSGWCTLKENETGKLWKFFLFYLPSWLIIFVIVYIYTKLAISLKNTSIITSTEPSQKRVIKRIIAYPLILTLTFLPITITRLLSSFFSTQNLYLLGISYFFYAIYGFFNAIAYGYTDIVVKNVKETILGRQLNYSILSSEI